MIAMRVMQMAIHQVADMVAVGHGLMTATRAMHVAFFVAPAVVVRRAAIGVCI
jgi:hypothetical protein